MKQLLLPIFLLLLTSVSSKAQSYFPPLIGSDWDTISPTELGWCADELDTLLSFLGAKNTKGFLILKDGKIAVEHYFGTFTEDSLWYWASAGKTLTAFLVGRAQESGLLSINDLSSDHLGVGWTSATTAQEGMITVRHQLSMSTGLNDGLGNADCTDPSCLQYLSDPGTRWAYHNAPYTLLGSVVEAASGQTYNGFTNNHVKNQIGMGGLWLQTGFNNVYFSTPRSMARFGLLMANNGVWNGDTVMHDQQYFSDMVNTSQNMNESYGYLWWLNGKPSYMLPGAQFVFPGTVTPSAPSEMFAAIGKNGQILSVVPSQGLVVVRMGNTPDNSLVPTIFVDDMWELIDALICNATDIRLEDANGFSLYPNPALDELRLAFPKGFNPSDKLTFSIHDLNGRKVMEHAMNGAGTISLAGIPSGTYLIRLAGDGTVLSKVFVKL